MPMKDTDKFEFMEYLNEISVALGTVELPKPKLAIYFDALKDLSLDAIWHAKQEVIRNEARFPAPKIIRDYANLHRKAQPQITQSSRGTGITPFGKDCANLISSLSENDIDYRQYLLAVMQLGEKHNRPPENYEWVNAEWNRCGFN